MLKPRIIKLTCLILLISLGVVFCWYAQSRIFAPYRSVRMVEVMDQAKRPESNVSALKVAAYNIAHGRGGKLGASNWTGASKTEMMVHLEAIANQVKAANVDILVLNEVDFDSSWSRRINQAKVIAAQAGFPYYVEQRNMDISLPFRRYCFGNAILSRHPIEDAQMIRFPALSKKEAIFAGNHDGLLAKIETPIGNIDILACHLEYRSEDIRCQTARVILNLVSESDTPFIAIGDFNSTPGFAKGHSRSGLDENAMDILLDSGLFSVGKPSSEWDAYLTFPSEAPARAIDWILTSPDLKQEALFVDPSTLSDHLMISSEVSLAEEGTLGIH
ncbi:endonuclease/exonuclease/phosphatase family protein [Rubellicoccus peritrichatus]|uniref:Endonuclease/exonuclease/phosphatase family protein n=1 Tax=Rubellicoccus peritrichatus TaxID=3080537 RepID=A0AAQ3QRW6_9BACT|nr:endonuclease/exonuclease/phosphatase family protein [Puniceicoccus sp. CR14]WOO39706.1 endonuclease/exonuclease/phosphatase family protein [Puniceicoccus sp. CR14]